MGDNEEFRRAYEAVVFGANPRRGIGTLGEKTLHAILKEYFAPDKEHQEVSVGPYVADIARNGEIIEIQTRDFRHLRKKLEVFLPLGMVTIVYPVERIKWILWVDRETGEVTQKRKSPKQGTPCRLLPELYDIREHLHHPNLRLCVLLLDVEEFRTRDSGGKGWGKGFTKGDKVPLELVAEMEIGGPEDYGKLIPGTLGERFTSRDYKKEAKLDLASAQSALNVLHHMGAVTRVGKNGNSYLYERTV